MKIIKNGQEFKVLGNGVEMVFFIKYQNGSNILKRMMATIDGVDLNVSESGLTYKKSGRGRIKNEKVVFQKIEETERWIRKEGYSITI